MKKLTLIAMMLISTSSFAVNKCIINGKTIYTQHPCEAGAKNVAINKGAFSDINGGGKSDFWENQGYSGAEDYAQKSRKAARHAELVRQATTGPNGNMTISEYRAAKRSQKIAIQLLGGESVNDKPDSKSRTNSSPTIYNTFGNTTYSSDGTVYIRVGNTTYGSDGTSATRIGNTTYGSDGTSATRIGSTTSISNGRSCNTVGNQTVCN